MNPNLTVIKRVQERIKAEALTVEENLFGFRYLVIRMSLFYASHFTQTLFDHEDRLKFPLSCSLMRQKRKFGTPAWDKISSFKDPN